MPWTAANLLALFTTAAALLDPNKPEARLLLTVEHDVESEACMAGQCGPSG